MKKWFPLCMGLLLTACITVNAQQNDTSGYSPSGKLVTLRNEVNLKAIRNFERDYGNAVNEVWYWKRNSWYALASLNGKIIQCRYTPAGRWINTILGYPEEMLDRQVKREAKIMYPGCRILWVNERRDFSQTIFFMTVAYGNQLRHIHFLNDTIEVDEAMTLEIPIPL
ncbi:hypothetical protein [Flavihumibacter petaseus]|uniref:Beta-lactamase-inhibitor-like PepSY-like domain-containing protein n=1 Tax=Flavihumibacter petaseus NBRC 106054 TaxID=1220578 RepID=A0A0E9N6C6_9BACT|nr:hypothetical protein [Flavihumibacter petaseus]GAO44890.1 hypothetical protein FPE01S_04_01330 [Flavihumibacter petaseus NBRC 106054]